MNILVTGANGQLGRCLRDCCDKYLKPDGYDDCWFWTDVNDAEGLHTDKLDITDADAVKKYVVDNSISVIVNCAAYTNVDKAETDQIMAYALNADAPKNLAEACKINGAKLIHISTDYVFNGTSFMPLTEERYTLPTSIYGKSKLEGEQNIINSGCKYLIFRTAWLYSEYGNNFVKTMLRLFNEKDEINVVNDQIGTPTYAGNLAKLIVNIIERTTPLEGKDVIPLLENGIYHFTDEGVASWYDFAYEIHVWSVRSTGSCRINGITTKEYGSKVKRPYYSVLDKTKYKKDFKGLYTPKNWRFGVREVVEKLLK